MKIKVGRNTLSQVGVFLVFGILCSCTDFEPSLRELVRLQSSGGELDAILSEIEVGATVSTPYLVFVVAAGESPVGRDPVLKVDRTEQPILSWSDQGQLLIKCVGSRVWHYQNFDVVRLKNGKLATPGVGIDCGEARG